MKAKYISADRILSEKEKAEFEKAFSLTSDAQKTYGQIILGIMKKLDIDAKEAEFRTGLDRKLFNNLEKPTGRILKRFVLSIAIGFGLDVHMTEYILESCGLRFVSDSRVDKAYITLLEDYKGEDIETCNAILTELGVNSNDLLGELERGEYKPRKTE